MLLLTMMVTVIARLATMLIRTAIVTLAVMVTLKEKTVTLEVTGRVIAVVMIG